MHPRDIIRPKGAGVGISSPFPEKDGRSVSLRKGRRACAVNDGIWLRRGT